MNGVCPLHTDASKTVAFLGGVPFQGFHLHMLLHTGVNARCHVVLWCSPSMDLPQNDFTFYNVYNRIDWRLPLPSKHTRVIVDSSCIAYVPAWHSSPLVGLVYW